MFSNVYEDKRTIGHRVNGPSSTIEILNEFLISSSRSVFNALAKEIFMQGIEVFSIFWIKYVAEILFLRI